MHLPQSRQADNDAHFTLLVLTALTSAAAVVFPAQYSDQTPNPAVMQTVEAASPEEIEYPGEPPLVKISLSIDYGSGAAIFSQNADAPPSECALLAIERGSQLGDAFRGHFGLRSSRPDADRREQRKWGKFSTG
jgi:hypothetical protein